MTVTEGSATSESKLAGSRCSRVRRWALFLCVSCALLAPLASLAKQSKPPVPPDPDIVYTPNPEDTTVFGPAAADVIVHQKSNFLECSGGPIALCYYSGPPPKNKNAPDLSCTVTTDEDFSNCRCIEIPYGPYFVDINAILDEEVYAATVKKCGHDGANCQRDQAPVCDAINRGTLFSRNPSGNVEWDTISTFSLALNSVPEYNIGVTNCLDENEARYSGCMTAPCTRTDETIEVCQKIDGQDVCDELPIDVCTCPNVTGPFQVGSSGKPDKLCSLPDGYTWSAAYNPNQALFSKLPESPVTATGCIPDAPSDKGCPMLPPAPKTHPPLPLAPVVPDPPLGFNCAAVCREYRENTKLVDNLGLVEVGFTCDATICTTPPVGFSTKDPLLIDDACGGLGENAPISKIAELEFAIGCSCCASQICGCEASDTTNEAVSDVNARQRLLGISPQCDYNGSLCGDDSPPPL